MSESTITSASSGEYYKERYKETVVGYGAFGAYLIIIAAIGLIGYTQIWQSIIKMNKRMDNASDSDDNDSISPMTDEEMQQFGHYLMGVYAVISLCLIIRALGFIFVTIEDCGEYLLVTHGPIKCSKIKIEYSNIESYGEPKDDFSRKAAFGSTMDCCNSFRAMTICEGWSFSKSDEIEIKLKTPDKDAACCNCKYQNVLICCCDYTEIKELLDSKCNQDTNTARI